MDLVNGLVGRKNVDLYITGSNSKFLSSDIVTEFRGSEINVRPLSFSEYRKAVDMDDRTAWQTYLTYGGLPESVGLVNEDKANYLTEIIKVVYMRDIIERKKVKSPDVLDKVFDVLSSAVGSLTNPNRIADIMHD